MMTLMLMTMMLMMMLMMMTTMVKMMTVMMMMMRMMLTRCKLLLSKSESVSKSFAVFHLNLIEIITVQWLFYCHYNNDDDENQLVSFWKLF